MLAVKNVAKILAKKQILHNINFCLKKGEIIALLGPNGSGKTTLMRCISGFYELDEGQISFDGKTIEDNRREFLQKMAYVPEVGGIYPEMNVYEYLRFMAQLRHLDEKEFADNLRQLAKELELESVMDQKCETLSKGYKKRTALAGGMIAKPELLILDEPTEGLDPMQKQSLRNILRNYGKNNIVLISTHVMEEVELLAERVLMIKNGRLVCDTTVQEMKKLSKENSVEESFCTMVGD